MVNSQTQRKGRWEGSTQNDGKQSMCKTQGEQEQKLFASPCRGKAQSDQVWFAYIIYIIIHTSVHSMRLFSAVLCFTN